MLTAAASSGGFRATGTPRLRMHAREGFCKRLRADSSRLNLTVTAGSGGVSAPETLRLRMPALAVLEAPELDASSMYVRMF